MSPVKEVVFERTFNAPREVVWKAWTDPKLLMQWWGPDNVIIPECAIDLKVGGTFYIVMEAGEAMGEYKGTRWPMKGTITALEANSKLNYATQAWTEGAEKDTFIDQMMELALADDSNKTKMVLKVIVTKIGSGAQMAIEGMTAGFSQQFDKLEKFLAK